MAIPGFDENAITEKDGVKCEDDIVAQMLSTLSYHSEYDIITSFLMFGSVDHDAPCINYLVNAAVADFGMLRQDAFYGITTVLTMIKECDIAITTGNKKREEKLKILLCEADDIEVTEEEYCRMIDLCYGMQYDHPIAPKLANMLCRFYFKFNGSLQNTFKSNIDDWKISTRILGYKSHNGNCSSKCEKWCLENNLGYTCDPTRLPNDYWFRVLLAIDRVYQ